MNGYGHPMMMELNQSKYSSSVVFWGQLEIFHPFFIFIPIIHEFAFNKWNCIRKWFLLYALSIIIFFYDLRN